VGRRQRERRHHPDRGAATPSPSAPTCSSRPTQLLDVHGEIAASTRAVHGGGRLGQGSHHRSVDELIRVVMDFAKTPVHARSSLGEITQQLWETTMNPGEPHLLKSRCEDAVGADEIFTS